MLSNATHVDSVCSTFVKKGFTTESTNRMQELWHVKLRTRTMAEHRSPPQKQAMPSFWDSIMDDWEAEKTLTEDQVVSYYDKWAKDGAYEKTVAVHGYGALDVLQQTMDELFPADHRSDIAILDVGACTGFAGQRLHQMGFRSVDALDPSSESLRVAEHKGVYRKLYNVYITAEPLDIPQDSYDAVIMVGAMGPKHVPLSAFTEMIRLVKPGGYIVNLVRSEYMERCQDYVSQWQPVVEGHVTAGRWRLLKEESYNHHFNDRSGYKHVFQIC